MKTFLSTFICCWIFGIGAQSNPDIASYPLPIFHGAYFIQQDAAQQFGVISKSGEIVVPFLYNRIIENEYGLTVFKINKSNGYERSYSMGFFNNRFKLVLPVAYHSLLPIENGKIIASTNETGLFGIVDTTGKISIPFSYQELYAPQNGLLLAKSNNQYGYISIRNQEMIDFQFSYAGNFSEELAPASTDKLIGFINKHGNFEIPMRYNAADEFENGFAQVFFGDRASMINHEGTILFPFIFNKINASYDSLFLFETSAENRENFEERLKAIGIPQNPDEIKVASDDNYEFSGDESYSENYYFQGIMTLSGNLIGGNMFTQVIDLGIYDKQHLFAVQSLDEQSNPNYNFALMNETGKLLTTFRFIEVHLDTETNIFLFEEEIENSTIVYHLDVDGNLVQAN